ncbi:peptidyl-prolyl cis-trans isomerase-like 2 [Cryptococcus neoformans]|nr:peptidyl-prolyl cis-trans isomerase-like 2 [Cryptococcus neoformans var. grubii c45]OXB34825.1 peptidyl-prolyl cis-trans isomerase-like 2 [Cryptococcus neoformans var. grubii]OXC58948.1 peptidyl-prolyl cis-trans isomerase-like 2 [Cryptococcus neoformans var. grubii MW-RSA852]OXH24956.1 peptidyl-prolyl cis-trans isomerase-like 2 [Cryptococcus neoformans var. grubii]
MERRKKRRKALLRSARLSRWLVSWSSQSTPTCIFF